MFTFKMMRNRTSFRVGSVTLWYLGAAYGAPELVTKMAVTYFSLCVCVFTKADEDGWMDGYRKGLPKALAILA